MPPVIMVRAIESLLSTLEKYVAELVQETDLPRQPVPPPPCSGLMTCATSTAPSQPLSEHDANLLTALFPSIRRLEEGTSTSQGRKLIRDYFDPGTEQDLMDFWKDEWIV